MFLVLYEVRGKIYYITTNGIPFDGEAHEGIDYSSVGGSSAPAKTDCHLQAK
mgnify:CR=1 FL=1